MGTKYQAPAAHPRQYPYLPEELWQRISSKLRTKEWAKAGGACYALQQLQPDRIDIWLETKESNVSALQWVANHWRNAKSVKFSMHARIPHKNAPRARGQCARRGETSHHHELRLEILQGELASPGGLPDGSLMLDISCREKLSLGKDTAALLQQLVAKAGHATMLDLDLTPNNPAMPLLVNLKHLSATINGYQDYMLDTLGSQLPNLETLHLCCDEEPRGRRSVSVGPSLKHICCEGFIPENVSVPEGCTIAIKLQEESHKERRSGVYQQILGGWSDANKGQIRSLELDIAPGEDVGFVLLPGLETLRLWSTGGAILVHPTSNTPMPALSRLEITSQPERRHSLYRSNSKDDDAELVPVSPEARGNAGLKLLPGTSLPSLSTVQIKGINLDIDLPESVQRLKLDAQGAVHVKQMVGTGVSKLTMLKISGRSVSIHLPASVQQLELAARGKLTLSFEDPLASAQKVESFLVEYTELQSGSVLGNFQKYLGLRKLALTCEEVAFEGPWGLMRPSGPRPDEAPGPVIRRQLFRPSRGCDCRCCSECVKFDSNPEYFARIRAEVSLKRESSVDWFSEADDSG